MNRFLTHLAVERNVAASTQNQAPAPVLFLCEHVLEQPLNRIEGVVRARRPKRLPVVLTREEVVLFWRSWTGRRTWSPPCYTDRGCALRMACGCV